MKKTVALILAVVLLLSFAGCGGTKFEGTWTVTEIREDGYVGFEDETVKFINGDTCRFLGEECSYSVNGDKLRFEYDSGRYVEVRYTIENEKNKEMSWDIVGRKIN